jgi:hypothetical protein
MFVLMACTQVRSLLLLALLLHGPPAALAAAFGSVCVDPPTNALCLSWEIGALNATFSAACAPPPGMKAMFWCAFGLSTASTGDMFPAEVVAIQRGQAPGSFFLEDRDSFQGYRSPPCYAQQVSQLLNASMEGSTLRAAWTRPLNLSAPLLAAHYQNIALGPGGMTLIAASSSDTSPATQACNPEMQLHTYCIPGTRVVF